MVYDLHEVTPEQLGATLTLITSQAPGLRAAGVAAVELDGDRVTIRLAPPFGAAPEPRGTAADEPGVEPEPDPEPDPLDDPATYGGEVPGFTLEDE